MAVVGCLKMESTVVDGVDGDMGGRLESEVSSEKSLLDGRSNCASKKCAVETVREWMAPSSFHCLGLRQ